MVPCRLSLDCFCVVRCISVTVFALTPSAKCVGGVPGVVPCGCASLTDAALVCCRLDQSTLLPNSNPLHAPSSLFTLDSPSDCIAFSNK